jgi:hypothetical protein
VAQGYCSGAGGEEPKPGSASQAWWPACTRRVATAAAEDHLLLDRLQVHPDAAVDEQAEVLEPDGGQAHPVQPASVAPDGSAGPR